VINVDGFDVTEFVEHHGIKGMHWGIRNPESRVRLARRNKRPASSDFKKSAPHRGQPAHTLTNKQLKSLNERMNLEQNYNRMNPNKVEKGHRAVKSLIAVGTTATTLYALYNSPLAKHLMSIGKTAAVKHHKLPAPRTFT
jgi:hypothetical protein